ncbi:hypothetical protein [Natronococcus wangiae]|uniref:hypothetical protein n=1 Tax=Natronococcus wangiae TaxID=3068275 RepID=UPI00273D5499|nr:hypothetical protein [Natronococcus sp. AD5]
MFGYDSRSIRQPRGRWTPKRTRGAGLAAILGAVILFGHIGYGSALQYLGIVPGYETVGSAVYYLSEGTLFLAWAGMFLGFAGLRARVVGLESRLWNVGSALTVIDTAMATVGFLAVTVAPAVGAIGVVEPGNMVIGLGVMIAVTVGTFLMGVSLLRTDAMPRYVAVLLLLVLPATLLAGPVGPALGVGIVIALLSIVPFVAAMIAIGNWLRTVSAEPVPAEPSD